MGYMVDLLSGLVYLSSLVGWRAGRSVATGWPTMQGVHHRFHLAARRNGRVPSKVGPPQATVVGGPRWTHYFLWVTQAFQNCHGRDCRRGRPLLWPSAACSE